MCETRVMSFHHRLMICLGAILLLVISLLAMGGSPSQGHDRQVDTRMQQLSVEDPRPVAKALELLEKRYDWIITYEDPRYVQETEIADVTDRVSRNLDQYPPGQAPRVLVPKGGSLNLSYDISPETNKPDSPAALIQTVLDANTSSHNAGIFHLQQEGQIFHVFPAQGSILDTRINLPDEERSVMETVEAILMAIADETGTKVEVGLVPINAFYNHRIRLGAEYETAASVLGRALEAIKPPTIQGGVSWAGVSWQLFYGPGNKSYFFNVHFVGMRGPASPSPGTVNSPSGGTQTDPFRRRNDRALPPPKGRVPLPTKETQRPN